jgi:hypothetical protein
MRISLIHKRRWHRDLWRCLEAHVRKCWAPNLGALRQKSRGSQYFLFILNHCLLLLLWQKCSGPIMSYTRVGVLPTQIALDLLADRTDGVGSKVCITS